MNVANSWSDALIDVAHKVYAHVFFWGTGISLLRVAAPSANSEASTSGLRRYRYDVLRVLSAIAVLVFHFDVEGAAYFPARDFDGMTVNLFGSPALNAGSLAVGIFWLLSGALSAGTFRDESFSTIRYYKKRLHRLFVPFYLSWFLVCCLNMLRGQIFSGIPIGRILLTVVGFDGYITRLIPHPPATFYLVGEWFFGALVLITLFHPILRRIYRTFGGKAIALLVVVDMLAYFLGIASWSSPLNCLALYSLGILFSLLREQGNAWRGGVFIVGLLLSVAAASPLCISFNNFGLAFPSLMSLSVGIFLMVDFMPFQFSSRVTKLSRALDQLKAPLTSLSGLTMYVFMFQHVLVKCVLPALPPSTFSDRSDYLFTVSIITALTFLVAFLAQGLEYSLRENLFNRHARRRPA